MPRWLHIPTAIVRSHDLLSQLAAYSADPIGSYETYSYVCRSVFARRYACSFVGKGILLDSKALRGDGSTSRRRDPDFRNGEEQTLTPRQKTGVPNIGVRREDADDLWILVV